MFENDTLTFVADDQLRKPIEEGTIANVAIRANKDGVRDIPTGKSNAGPWMRLNVEVVDGPHKGDWASAFISVSPNEKRFRTIFQVVTGIDISQGGSASWQDFESKLLSGVFRAELGPERKRRKSGDDQYYAKALENDKTEAVEPGELYTTGYTTVRKLIERVGDYDGFAAQEAHDLPAIAPAESYDAVVADEEIPF